MIAWLLAVPEPVDPGVLDTVAQNPDDVREQACRIVEATPSVCSPPSSTLPDDGGSGGVDLSFLGVLFWVLLAAAVVLLLVAVVRALAARSPRQRTQRRSRADDEVDDVETGAVRIDRSREPTDWRAAAEQHRRDGRYRDAMRCRYRALVGDLARRGLIDEIPGRTTGEERMQLRDVRPSAAGSFDAAADLFDDAWYGCVDVDASDDDRFQALERDVLTLVGAPR